ncbi:MAG: hypothetical protein QXQ90_05860 [Desulfurococcaceae archaeon]
MAQAVKPRVRKWSLRGRRAKPLVRVFRFLSIVPTRDLAVLLGFVPGISSYTYGLSGAMYFSDEVSGCEIRVTPYFLSDDLVVETCAPAERVWEVLEQIARVLINYVLAIRAHLEHAEWARMRRHVVTGYYALEAERAILTELLDVAGPDASLMESIARLLPLIHDLNVKLPPGTATLQDLRKHKVTGYVELSTIIGDYLVDASYEAHSYTLRMELRPLSNQENWSMTMMVYIGDDTVSRVIELLRPVPPSRLEHILSNWCTIARRALELIKSNIKKKGPLMGNVELFSRALEKACSAST